ncbi:MAG: hypothetical protein RLZZ127_529 [Planctomycetota bacterium]|jgi:hypothetical protein
MSHPAPALVVLALATAPLAAVEPPRRPEPVAITPAATVAVPVWRFEERPDRVDVLYDLEVVLAIQKEAAEAAEKRATQTTKNPGQDSNADALLWAQREESRIKGLLAERRYEEVVQASESVLRQIERYLADPAIARIAALISGYRTQAQDALDRIDAEREFRALAIKVEGILWAENGTKLAILSTEPAAVGLNQTIKKKATVISIATDRVDFRFHHDRSRRRFEFPVYVGEDPKAAAATTPAR